ncbi:hypothetical protein MSG28_005660 [Choristoneura fumiferana]|uniref:Uncharacterized protein n=1 Tax=Choristoneura fumiferana TaxID=7141 RepID=A0ACC0L0X5_CHOFU|nr:hypothetical protein MSG28_005660 [Choristoneura fumiferana]
MLRKSRDIPGPPTVPGLGNALSISDVIGEMRQQYGDVFRFWLGPDLNVIVSDPEEAKARYGASAGRWLSRTTADERCRATRWSSTRKPTQYLIVFKRMTKWYLQIDLLYYLTKLYHQQQVFIKKMLDLGDSIVRLRLKILETMTDEKKRELLDSKSDEKSNTELSVVDRLSQEATAKITSYLLQMMAYHPECQEKLYAEIQDVLDANEKDVTDEHIKQMTYLDMVFKEVIRLFPIGQAARLSSQYSTCSVTRGIGRIRTHLTQSGRYFGTKLVKTVSVKILREFRLTSPERYEDMRLVMAVSVASVNGYPVQLHPRNVDETQTTAPIPLTPHKPSVSVSPLKPTVSPKTPLKPSDSSVPTMHQNPSGQVLPVLSNPTSSSIGSPKPKATSSTNTSDVIEQDRTRQVAVVDSNMSRMSLDDINSIQNQLQKSLWNHMIDPKTSTRPTFKYCLVLEPFGLIFICCNLDAVEWLTLTTENTPFAGHNLVVILDDLENKLPKTVDMYVNISTDLVHDNIESVFNVLVRTNQSWLNTRQWRLVPNKCVSVTSLSPSDVTCLCVVFSVPLNDILRLRREEFKLHFLFGVVPVDYYEETKKEVIEN